MASRAGDKLPPNLYLLYGTVGASRPPTRWTVFGRDVDTGVTAPAAIPDPGPSLLGLQLRCKLYESFR